jgi:aryl-alcohol dehydrogenase-like predicted oxidoreductase
MVYQQSSRSKSKIGRTISMNEISRRAFVRKGSKAAAGAIVSALARTGSAGGAADSSKILNHNSKMGYRPLGKTGLMLSEVGLGGHWKDRRGDRYWDVFTNDEVPCDVAKNRTEVVSACIDAGINYLDIGTSAECLAYGAALKGRRDKMIIAADDYRLSPRKAKNCTVKKLTFDIEQCCRRLGTDYLDIWRAKADMYGRSTDAHVQIMIETFQKAKEAGKVLHFGISSHSRPWLEHVIESFDEIEIVSFPCTAKTKEKGTPPVKDTVEEVKAGFGADTTQSIFEIVRQHNIGLVAIKPFLGGKLFKSKAKFPVEGPGTTKENDLARLTLQCILTNDAITATIPGLTTVHEVQNAVMASHACSTGMTPAEEAWLSGVTDERLAALPEDYVWLRDWHIV